MEYDISVFSLSDTSWRFHDTQKVAEAQRCDLLQIENNKAPTL